MKNAESSAFPIRLEVGIRLDREGNHESIYKTEPGLTKREYFAAMAMQGLLSGFDGNDLLKHSVSGGPPELIARKALQCADVLLAKLEAR